MILGDSSARWKVRKQAKCLCVKLFRTKKRTNLLGLVPAVFLIMLKDQGRLRRGPTRTTSCTDRRTRRKRNKARRCLSLRFYIESPEILLEESSAKPLNVLQLLLLRVLPRFSRKCLQSILAFCKVDSSTLFLKAFHILPSSTDLQNTLQGHSTRLPISCLPMPHSSL
jgi:hypothetical protein